MPLLQQLSQRADVGECWAMTCGPRSRRSNFRRVQVELTTWRGNFCYRSYVFDVGEPRGFSGDKLHPWSSFGDQSSDLVLEFFGRHILRLFLTAGADVHLAGFGLLVADH